MLLPFLLLSLFPAFLRAIPIDNGVTSHPEVSCGSRTIRVDIATENPFHGRLFVKGESGRPECSRSGGQSNEGYHAGRGTQIELKFGECNMRRQRTLYPRGVEYTVTIVVSFHAQFITKVDRAYRVRCFYMEGDKFIETGLDVSMLTTHQINQQFPMPQCRYNLRKGGIDGPPLRYARVGEKVVHTWECDNGAAIVYGILVKNCYVDDGHGNKAELIDERGCARDPHLVPGVHYGPDLITAYVQTHVFKYPDTSSLQFACTVRLCFKQDGGCDGLTPPKCGDYGGGDEGVFGHPPEEFQNGPREEGEGYAPGPPPLRPFYPPSESGVPHHPFEGPPEFHNGPPPPPGPFEPYKLDDPIDGDNNSTSKRKRAIAAKEAETTMEADLLAPTMIVFPMEDPEDQAELKQLDESYIVSNYRYASSLCLSPGGLGLLIGLFLALILLCCILSCLYIRRYWSRSFSKGSNKA